MTLPEIKDFNALSDVQCFKFFEKRIGILAFILPASEQRPSTTSSASVKMGSKLPFNTLERSVRIGLEPAFRRVFK